MKPCFILFNNSVSSIDYAEETGSISSENEIFFNDKGKLEAYSYKDKDGKVVTKKL